MKRVLVDQDIHPTQTIVDNLPSSWEVSVGIDADPGRLATALTAVDIVLLTSRIDITASLLEEIPALDVIGKLGTGIDNVDLDAAEAAGIPVVYTPGYNALSVAELGLGLLLGTARRFTEARQLIESGQWRDAMTLGTRISGSTVGIIGLGNVGKRFAKLLTGFDVDLCYTDPYIPSIDGELVDGRAVDLATLLETSDVVCVMPELTTETRGLIGSREFRLMRSDAIVINTARGPVIDQDALIEALQSGEIAGAGLDVFATEPIDSDSPLLAVENVVVTPHVGAMTHEGRTKTITQLAKNVRAVIAGDPVEEACVAVPPR